MSADAEPMAYVARQPCGCLLGLVVDDGTHVREMARDLGTWTRAGGQLERMTVEAARLVAFKCLAHQGPALRPRQAPPKPPTQEALM